MVNMTLSYDYLRTQQY